MDALEHYYNNDLLPTHSLVLYRYLEAINYPQDENGKMRAMIHPQLQSKDYEPLRPGDPMFLTFEGEMIT